MPRVSNTVDKARTLLERRLRELDDERTAGRGAHRRPRQERQARARAGRAAPAGTRRRRGGTRADQAVKIISENPGITVSELGKKMKLKRPNYLYRVLPRPREGRPDPQARARATTPASPHVDQPELLDRVALLLELGDAGVDPLAREVGDLEALDDLPLAARARAGEAARSVPPRRRRSRPRGPPSRPSRPSGVPSTQSWTWSIAALAAEAALEAPRASMIAAPRLATVGMNSSAIHSSSPTCVPGRAAVDLGVDEVRVLGGRVVAPDGHVA